MPKLPGNILFTANTRINRARTIHNIRNAKHKRCANRISSCACYNVQIIPDFHNCTILKLGEIAPLACVAANFLWCICR